MKSKIIGTFIVLGALSANADSADLRSKYLLKNQIQSLLTQKILSAQEIIDETNEKLSQLCSKVDHCEKTKDYEELYLNLLQQEEIAHAAKLALQNL